MDPRAPRFHHEPLKIADETFLIRQLQGEGEGPVAVYCNSLVIRAKEPVIVDTGTQANRKQWMEDVFSLVDPKDVRWIFISHDDIDHTGNIRQVLEACPNATLITNWFMVERMSGDYTLPLNRMRWMEDGETFEAGDRTLAAVRPPVFDSPTTRGLYDTKTGLYWGSDSFASPVVTAVDNAADIDEEFWRMGATHFNQIVSPWYEWLDKGKWDANLAKYAKLDITALASGHGPVVTGDRVGKMFELLRDLPGSPRVMPMPGQAELEAIVASMMEEQDGEAA